ncbi:hypothetical protein [Kitasatospora sp. NBC_01302]|uniref:hypothetical protein n=1 Tax=Kitasatospora sp. NBC_01302 TaxID=2903575 RepID=UPI002E0EA30D|nr:hypothetical protein OG294_36070 [Kitasatospora sp. NBC_01302]
MVDYAHFKALGPFMELVEESLAGLTDGEHYFDLFADDVVMEFLYAPPDTARAARIPKQSETIVCAMGSGLLPSR